MKVSVIIPLYNAEKYIAECIDSVINQTYCDIEIIVVDDGSTDCSLDVVKSFYGSNERVIVLSQENRGGCAARNVGLQKATGEYIQFLDADDKLDEKKIQAQMELLESLQFPKNVLVFSQWTKMGMPVAEMGLNQTSVWHDYENPIDILVDFALNQCCLPPSVYLTPADLIREVGGWNETLKRNQDGEFFARILSKTATLRFSNNAVAYYRSTLNSVSKTISPQSADSWVRSLMTTSDIIVSSQHPQSEEAVCKMLSACLCCLYPYYSEAREKGEKYLKVLFPHYVVRYPKLNWKEWIWYRIQCVRNGIQK